MPNDTKTLLAGSPEWNTCIDHLELCPSCDTKSRISLLNKTTSHQPLMDPPRLGGSFAWALADNHTQEMLSTLATNAGTL